MPHSARPFRTLRHQNVKKVIRFPVPPKGHVQTRCDSQSPGSTRSKEAEVTQSAHPILSPNFQSPRTFKNGRCELSPCAVITRAMKNPLWLQHRGRRLPLPQAAVQNVTKRPTRADKNMHRPSAASSQRAPHPVLSPAQLTHPRRSHSTPMVA